MISYAITVCNEYKELDRLLELLTKKLSLTDEIVVLVDLTNTNEEVKKVLSKYEYSVRVHLDEFKKDFAEWKNKLKNLCYGEYIFFLDADEIPSETLLSNLHIVLNLNPDIDLIVVPRHNIVDGIPEHYIQKWNWNFDEQERINWPDYQTRICKNIPTIMWSGKVHERLVGYKLITNLPAEESWCLYHLKSFAKQLQQNELYSSL